MEPVEEPEYLLKQADRCKAVAKSASDDNVRRTLLAMAREYEDRAYALLAKK